MRTVAVFFTLTLLVAGQACLAQEVFQQPAKTRPLLPGVYQPLDNQILTIATSKAPEQQGAAGAKFKLQQVRYTGNTVFAEMELIALAADKLDSWVTMADIEQIRFKVSQHYANNGYINSGAVIPDQKIENGSLLIQVIEGKLSTIQIEGADGLQDNYLLKRLQPVSSEVFHLPQFQERYQLLLADPLIAQLNGQFVPGERLGESALKLQVSRAPSNFLSFQVDNHGSPSTGQTQGSLTGQSLNLTGIGDSLFAKVRRKQGSTGAEIDYAAPLFSSSTKLGVKLAFNDAEVIEQQLQSLDIQSDFKSAELYLLHPLHQSLRQQWQLGISLSMRENQGELLDIPFSFASGEQNGFSRVSAIRVGVTGIIRNEREAWSVFARYSQGLGLFNATRNNQGLPDSDFSSLLLQVQYVRRLADINSQLLWRTDLQISNRGLLPLEQIALGGANSVRGYRENELVRDNGLISSIELQTRVWDELDYNGKLGSLEAFVFTDFGEGSYKSNLLDNADPLWSVGGGFRWHPWDKLELEFIYGHAIKDARPKANEVLQDRGIHLRLSYAIF